jgi:hypothetical protein
MERDGKRKRAYGKDSVTAVHKLVSAFDYGVIINANNKNADETIKAILSYLPHSAGHYGKSAQAKSL